MTDLDRTIKYLAKNNYFHKAEFLEDLKSVQLRVTIRFQHTIILHFDPQNKFQPAWCSEEAAEWYAEHVIKETADNVIELAQKPSVSHYSDIEERHGSRHFKGNDVVKYLSTLDTADLNTIYRMEMVGLISKKDLLEYNKLRGVSVKWYEEHLKISGE